MVSLLEQLIIHYNWSHQIQNMSLAPWIFGFAVDVKSSPGLHHDFFVLRIIAVYISIFHHPSWYDAKNFFFCVFEDNSQVILRLSMSLGFNSYGNQFPCFWIIPMTFKHLEIVDRSTFNDSTSSSCVWLGSWSSKASTSSSSSFFWLA